MLEKAVNNVLFALGLINSSDLVKVEAVGVQGGEQLDPMSYAQEGQAPQQAPQAPQPEANVLQ